MCNNKIDLKQFLDDFLCENGIKKTEYQVTPFMGVVAVENEQSNVLYFTENNFSKSLPSGGFGYKIVFNTERDLSAFFFLIERASSNLQEVLKSGNETTENIIFKNDENDDYTVFYRTENSFRISSRKEDDSSDSYFIVHDSGLVSLGGNSNEISLSNLSVGETVSINGASGDGGFTINDSGVTLSGQNKGINLYGNALGVDIRGNGGAVKINGYSMPDSDGDSGQVLTTDGEGIVTWEDAGGGNQGLQSILEAGNETTETIVFKNDENEDYTVFDRMEGVFQISSRKEDDSSYSYFSMSDSGSVNLGGSNLSNLSVGETISMNGTSGNGGLAINDSGVTLSGQNKGINLHGNALGVNIEGQGGTVKINGYSMPDSFSDDKIVATDRDGNVVFRDPNRYISFDLSKSDIENLHVTPYIVDNALFALQSGERVRVISEKCTFDCDSDITQFLGIDDLLFQKSTVPAIGLDYTVFKVDKRIYGNPANESKIFSGFKSENPYPLNEDEFQITTASPITVSGAGAIMKFRICFERITL